MTSPPIETPEVGELLQAINPRVQLQRKVRVTKIMAIVETITYCILIPLMFRKYIQGLDEATNVKLVRKVTAYFHGMISVAYGVMILDIFRAMHWSKRFTLLTLAGPPGALIAHRRLRKQPLPVTVRREDMFF